MRIQARKRRLYAVTAVYDILCKSYDYVMLLDGLCVTRTVRAAFCKA